MNSEELYVLVIFLKEWIVKTWHNEQVDVNSFSDDL